MQWTNNLPTKVGYYWVKISIEELSIEETLVVEVVDIFGKGLCSWMPGVEGDHLLTEYGTDTLWYGPISPPSIA